MTTNKPFPHFANCPHASYSKQPQFVCTDHGSPRKYYYINIDNSLVCHVKLDKGYFPPDASFTKNDYLVINCPNNIAYLIELKGKDLNHAATQILNTLNILNVSIAGCVHVHARVVLSKTPSPAHEGAAVHKLKKALKRMNGCLISRTREMRESVSGIL